MILETVKNKTKDSSTFKRTLTSVIYVVIVVALCAMKWCIPRTEAVFGTIIYWGSLGFDIVFCGIAVIGCLEFLRAIDGRQNSQDKKISFAQRTFTIAFCAVVVPLCVILEMTWQAGLLAVAALYGAIELAKKPENKGKVIVALLPDTGARYYSTPLFTE